MSNERKHHTPEEKVAILRRHLVDRVPVSTLCDEYQLHPTVFYRWLKQFFENGAAASRQRPAPSIGPRRSASRSWRKGPVERAGAPDCSRYHVRNPL